MSSNRTPQQEHDLPHLGLIQLSSSGRDFASVTSTNPPIDDLPYNLITFLAIAQKLEIDFLPITWQPALSEVGTGGTAEIRQSLIHLQMSFAFKVIKDAKRIEKIDETQRPSEVKSRFWALIREISVLGHPSVREHPNIISLLGICWDILPSGRVWPVLIFEKAALGDLWRFAASEEGKNMSNKTRLKLCADVATAIRDLHQASKRILSLLTDHT